MAVCKTVRVQWPRIRQMFEFLDIIRLPVLSRLRFEWLLLRLVRVDWSALRLVTEYKTIRIKFPVYKA